MTTDSQTPTSLARYVPRVSAEWDLEASGLWQELDGTLCYIDISGFTNLSEKLARRGRIGAEELTEVLNHVFGQMLVLAYDRGGSLLKFGGDALLLLFEGEDHPTQACSAAVEMQAVLREAANYQTSAGKLHLKMSVGLHSGTVHLFRVGDSHKELILTGPAASMTTQMEETAVAGEVLISSATKADIPKGAAPGKKGDGWLLKWRKPRLERCGWSQGPPAAPKAVAAGMPVALREYLQYGAAEPEHRIATVGFIKYSGVDALMESGGPEAVAQALDELIRNVQAAVDDEAVTFLATDIDQDGGKVILVAGVPGAQEDDEGRVLRAVRRIADNRGALDLRIGVNQGHVFVGEIGTDFRATYTIMGDTVNLAARLMAASSPGEVYASPTVLDRSLTLFETTALEPFYVKGKEQPVQAYAVGQEAGSRPVDRTGELPFVGRVDEVAQLTGAIDDLKEGKGGAIAVIGETGIGKSRLVDQALPALDGTHHVNIRSEPYGAATPYRALRDPLRAILGVERGSHEEMAAQLQEAVKALDPGLLPMLPFVAEVAMVEVESTPEADAIEPKFRQDRTAEVLVELFAKAFAGPILFEAEDGHWMDDATAHVLERIVTAAQDHPWLVLTTRRDEEGGFKPAADEIPLGPLPDEDARELIIKATEAAPLRPHDLEAIVARAGGLPLFLEEIIRAVREAGGVDALPDSLDAVVGAQIDALAPLLRRLLRYASVLGRSFRIATLNDLIADEQVELDSATRDQLSGFLDQEGEDRLRFRHALIRDVAYGGLSFRRRKELHLRAGELAELAAGDDAEKVADVLALHFSLGGDHEKTWRYARIAGDQAKEAYANVEAALHYERAIEASRRLAHIGDTSKSGVWAALAQVREFAGLYPASLDAFTKASELLRGDPIAEARLSVKRANVKSRTGSYRAALRETARGLRLIAALDGRDAASARAALYGRRGVVLQDLQRPKDALAASLQAAEEARAADDDESLARAYDTMDWAYRLLGRPELAVHAIEALEIFERLRILSSAAFITNNLGGHAFFEGRWDDAVAAYQRSREAFLRSGDDVAAAMTAANIAEVLISQVRLDEADQLLEDSTRVLRASDFKKAMLFAQIQQARLSMSRADYEGAEGLLAVARAEALEMGEAYSAIEATIYLADVRLRQEDAAGALAILEELHSKADGVPPHLGAIYGRARAKTLAALGEHEQAIRETDGALVAARDQGLLYEEALLLLTRGEVASRAGQEPDPSDLAKARRVLTGLGVQSLS